MDTERKKGDLSTSAYVSIRQHTSAYFSMLPQPPHPLEVAGIPEEGVTGGGKAASISAEIDTPLSELGVRNALPVCAGSVFNTLMFPDSATFRHPVAVAGFLPYTYVSSG